MSEPFEPGRPVLGMGEPATSARPYVGTSERSDLSSAFLPVLILALSLLAWFGFQAMQLRAERDAIRDTGVAQTKRIDEAKKLLDSLDAIARGTNQLADAGNPNARLIVDELKKRGITISSQAPSASAPVQAPADK